MSARCCRHCACSLEGFRKDRKACDPCKKPYERAQAFPRSCEQCSGPLVPGRDPRYRFLCSEACIRGAELEGRINGNRVSPRDPYWADPLPEDWGEEVGGVLDNRIPSHRRCQCDSEPRTSRWGADRDTGGCFGAEADPTRPLGRIFGGDEPAEPFDPDGPLWDGMHVGRASPRPDTSYVRAVRDPDTGDWLCWKCGKYVDDEYAPVAVCEARLAEHGEYRKWMEVPKLPDCPGLEEWVQLADDQSGHSEDVGPGEADCLPTRTLPAGEEFPKQLRRCVECGGHLRKGKQGNRCAVCDKKPVYTYYRPPLKLVKNLVNGNSLREEVKARLAEVDPDALRWGTAPEAERREAVPA